MKSRKNLLWTGIKDTQNIESIVFIDTEVTPRTGKILDYGAVSFDNRQLHTKSSLKFQEFVKPYHYACGHNILEHDIFYLRQEFPITFSFYENRGFHFYSDFVSQMLKKEWIVCPIDTLYLSPLLFPSKPYHALVKDDKLQTEEWNNPLNDAIKAKELFYDECSAYQVLPEKLQDIYYSLLHKKKEFKGFFSYINKQKTEREDIEQQIRTYFKGRICEHAKLSDFISNYSIELTYCLAFIAVADRDSVIPRWVHIHFPYIENIMRQLRGIPCREGCVYCEKEWSLKKKLKTIFGYDEFRTYEGNPLQENAVQAAVRQESLLAIFPTGGGKSLTFQLPALIAGDVARELTVVISPLQSLMKDQVDNMEKKGIADAVTVNGLLSPLERAEALERVENGLASILYISPEMLRSKTIERLLMSRSIARFVIDEAHCFSAWGQDFRVDYLYIGDFIKELQEKKSKSKKIPVSCFTATAKQKVISDIKDYFKNKLELELTVFATGAARENLKYQVLYKETEEEKYITLRNLLEQKSCPTIVYVSRTERAWKLADKLCQDGFLAKPFHGQMESSEKRANQEAFIQDDIQIIVATSAFGMGVDKSNVGLVIHYDISSSLENYVQEAGRAGRDPSIRADCYVLFNDDDLDKHFLLLNQKKLSLSEIQQVWRAIRILTGKRNVLKRSPLEIARQAGWEETSIDMETRVKTAVQALENAGYIRRGKNVPHVYATSILVPNMIEAEKRISESRHMDDKEKENAKRILQMLISKRSIAKTGTEEAESRIDYISDILGIEKSEVIHTVNSLREEGILADTKDLTAYIKCSDKQNRTENLLNKYILLEEFLLFYLNKEQENILLKELNEKAQMQGIKSSSVSAIKTIFYFWIIKNYMKKSLNLSSERISFMPKISWEEMQKKIKQREDIAKFITKYLFEQKERKPSDGKEEILVLFSPLEIKREYEIREGNIASEKEIEDALLFLSKTDCIRLEGGFLVLYNGMEITRLEMNNKIRYKKEDYRQLDEFYKQKIQQIHIVGEYANMMVKDYQQALQFVSDYFQMDYRKFLDRYFRGERLKEIEWNVTPGKYKKLFCELSDAQKKIIQDKESRYIVVAAGPGSGKTRVLVHKLASLLLLEDIKHEQLLMVTFSRAAATEFKQRLYDLIGNAVGFVEIKTFDSYCFDLLGRVGTLEETSHIVEEAVQMIQNGDVETGKITKTVVVIDEAQDMDKNEFALIQAMMDKNEEMRVIAVGDDDQNIFQFRGSDSKYMQALIEEMGAVKYDLLENYRSSQAIIEFANAFASTIENRMKINPIVSVKKEQGIVKLIRYYSNYLEVPVVNHLLKTKGNSRVCVLTNTNNEALKVWGLLLRKGQKAKLIQSNIKFNLYNLIEIRYFLQMVKKRGNLPLIRDDIWEEVKNDLQKRYEKSESLPICINILKTFEKTNEKKYLTDFEEFVKESKLEDFYQSEQNTILVSTIHKAKGKEFDKVYLLLNRMELQSDENRRKLYVGITRAKEELYIHYNNSLFDEIAVNMAESVKDDNKYYPLEEMISQLSHKDVNLGFFKGKEYQILQLYSGMKLEVTKEGLWLEKTKVVCFSKQYKNDMQQFKKLGYIPIDAKIRFILTWQDKKEKTESVIILPDIRYKKQN